MYLSKLSKHFFTVTCFLLSICAPVLHAEKTTPALSIIPKPSKVEMRSGAFELGPKTQIYLESNNADAGWVSKYLSGLLSKPMGHTIPVHVAESAGQHQNAIVLSLKGPATLGPEGYEMIVSRDVIDINASCQT